MTVEEKAAVGTEEVTMVVVTVEGVRAVAMVVVAMAEEMVEGRWLRPRDRPTLPHS